MHLPPLRAPAPASLAYLDDGALPCNAAEVVVEHAQANDVKAQRQELGLHVHNRGALQATGGYPLDTFSHTSSYAAGTVHLGQYLQG